MKPENCSALNKLCLCDVCIVRSIEEDENIPPELSCSGCCNGWHHVNFDEDETLLNRICKKHHLDYDEALTYLYWKEFNNYCKKIDNVDEKTYNKAEYEAESKKNLELICAVKKARAQFETKHLICASEDWSDFDAHLDHLAELKQRFENCTIKTFLKIIGVECNYKITHKVTREEILEERDLLVQSIDDDIQLTEENQYQSLLNEQRMEVDRSVCKNSKNKSTAVKPKMELSELLLKLFLGFLGACGLFILIVFVIICIQCC